MRRLVWWASRLYPPSWRERYGAEFEALLEDAALEGGDVWDVLRGACIMRLTKVNIVTITAAFALAGGVIAGVASLARFSGYTSTGVMRVQPADEKRETAAIAVQQAIQVTMSRTSLAEIMQRPSLNLYRAERTSQPLEDVIERMRKDTLIRFTGFQAGRLTVSVGSSIVTRRRGSAPPRH